MRPRVAFLGSPEFAVASLRALAAAADIALVITQPDRPAGRGRKLEPTAVRLAAAALGVVAITWERGQRRAIEARCASLDLDALVVVAFGHILRPSMLASARRGAVNVHASLLPRWRGVAPIERAILAGDVETGVTLMELDAGVDTGPTLAQRRVVIEPDDTRITLTERWAAAGAELLARELGPWVRGEVQPVPQPEAGASYAPRLEKAEGRLEWDQPATVLWNRVRGLYGWPGAFTTLAGTVLKVHAVRPLGESAAAAPGVLIAPDARHGIRVACGAGTLELLTVQLPGKPAVAAADLVRGRVLVPGARLGA